MASIEIIHRKSGPAYRIRYYLDGKQHYKYLPPGLQEYDARIKKAEIELKVARHKAGIKPFKTSRPQSLYVDEFRDWFLSKKEVSDQTIEIYDRAFKLLPNVPVDKIDLSNLRQVLSDYSKTSQSIYVRALRAAWNFGTKRGKVKDNPFLKIEISNTKKLPDILTVREKDRIFEKLKDPETRLAFMIIRFTGIRRSELLSLDWKDVYFDEDIINIPKAKTGMNQQVPMLPTLKSYLLAHRCKGKIVSLHPDTITHRFKSAMSEAGIYKTGSVHILRHSLGAELRAQGVDIRDIQDVLRHSSIFTTQIYTQLSKKLLAKRLKDVVA